MPTIFTHPATPLAIGLGLGSVLISEIIQVWIPCIIIWIGLYVMKGTIAVTFGWLGHGNRQNG